MSARGKARKRALDILYASDLRGEKAVEALDRAIESGEGPRIDDLLSTYAKGWTLQRMPAVDRNVLRLGVWELLYADDVPDAVAVSEAMNLVRDLSTDDSPAFVNGVLGGIVRDKATLAP